MINTLLGQRIIDSFRGDYRFLSNFYPSPMTVRGLPEPVADVEHAYQAFKTLDVEEQLNVIRTFTPGQAKRMGRVVTKRLDWDNIKAGIMYVLVLQKFTDHVNLRELLLATKDTHLIEGNTWGDTYWGMCGGLGKNMLGIILMNVRDQFSVPS